MNRVRNWFRQWNWVKIGTWTVVIGACCLFWYWIFRLIFG